MASSVGNPSGEAGLDTLESAAQRRRREARRLAGVTGSRDAPTFRATGTRLYPAVGLGLLIAVNQFQTIGMTIMAPEIAATLGISKAGYGFVVVLRGIVLTNASLVFAAVVQRRAWRASLSVVTAIVYSVLLAAMAFVSSIWELAVVVLASAAVSATTRSVHEPLLLDSYPPPARLRSMSLYRGFESAGGPAAILVIALCLGTLSLSWRGAFLRLAAVALACSAAAGFLRDPGFGARDDRVVRAAAGDGAGARARARAEPNELELGFLEIVQRLLLIPTVRRLLAAYAVLGLFLAPFLTYLSFFLQERWDLGRGPRTAFFGVLPLFSVVALLALGRRGDALFRENPSRVLEAASALIAVGVVGLAVAVLAPVFVLAVVGFGVVLAAVTVVSAAIAVPMYSVVPARMRPHLSALSAIALTAVGGTAGLVLLSGAGQLGTAGAIVALALPGVAAAVVIRGASRSVDADLDHTLDLIIESEEVRRLHAAGVRLPMLACRHIDFSYGQLQVLFGVDFTVEDGEMVALLGTNGAGKSTLLRVISGLGLPSRGSVRLEGTDITHLAAERRVELGINQIPGGRAIFGPMTVVENLRVTGYAHGRDRRAVDAGIEASFEAFPRLAERRNQLAATLSGGEQQMLGLATALILRPRLLLVDELSLGLAPKIVAELLAMVRKINEGGTAVVLVEQSVNIALSLVRHAYFMEKGEIRFDGPAADLLARPDLLRSVFLEGAGRAFNEQRS